MKQTIFLLVAVFISALFLTTGCMERTPAVIDSLMTDSIVDTTSVDSLSQMIEEEEMPLAADELFDDFFFNFAGSRKVQRDRIVFPVAFDNMGKPETIEKNAWKNEHFFMPQGYYTLVFNNFKETKLMADTTVSDVTVERIAIRQGKVRQWHFARKRGLWQMDSMKLMSLKSHPDAAFLSFYQRFVTDSTFQQTSLANPVTFTGPDPDDDFSTMTGEIMPEQWPMFAPWMPSGTIYNIVYGAKAYPHADTRFFYIRGIANGMQTDLIFTRKGKSWQLKKVNT